LIFIKKKRLFGFLLFELQRVLVLVSKEVLIAFFFQALHKISFSFDG